MDQVGRFWGVLALLLVVSACQSKPTSEPPPAPPAQPRTAPEHKAAAEPRAPEARAPAAEPKAAPAPKAKKPVVSKGRATYTLGKASKKGKVAFNHRKHQTRSTCKKCHHKMKPGEQVKGCRKCHKGAKFKKVAHKNCKSCHKARGGPKKCKECHKK